MPRVRRGFKARQRRNRTLRHAKGFYSARSRQYSIAVENVHNAWQYAFAHRRRKKRDFRRLWIARISAAARLVGTSYSKLIAQLRTANVRLDRKVLSDIAIHDPAAFEAIAKLKQSTSSARQ
ncbi:MAG: 50S ribosomal protein L20 [Myxococcales bacterium]|nr:50S ribosomal protein L20 [Myxococcales bacterium]MCB9708212.1 50S ribosomal protein L20 [Myxococcales bacterium]